MFFTNLLHGWRHLRLNPLFTLINTVGLVIGITGALFIFIYLSFELSFDRFHRDAGDIYRVLGVDEALGVTSNNVGITMPPLGPAMEDGMPEVLESVRLRVQGEGLVSVGDEYYYTDYLAYTEDALFEVFDFPLRRAHAGALLDEPGSAVLTESFARRLFGEADPLGKVFRLNNTRDLEVVGVLADNRADSHLQFDVLASLYFQNQDEESNAQLQRLLSNWGTIQMVTYVKLAPGASEPAVEEKLQALVAEHDGMPTFSATLQPLVDAHLGSREVLFDDNNRNKGDAQKIAMLGSVAGFLLLIAAFNFMNLSTARASLRAKEVGVRKAAGATRAQLAGQFLLESFLLVGAAALFGLLLLRILEPVVSLPLDEGFLRYFLGHGSVVLIALGALLLLALVAGSYPAFVLSSFAPVMVLKGKFANTAQGLWLRRGLVVVQFAISITIIIGMIVVNQQLDYMKNRDPGFERDGIVTLALNDQVLRSNFEALRNRLLAVPEVLSVAASSNMPGNTFGRVGVGNGNPDEFFIMSVLGIDSQYLDTLSMRLAEGRNYSRDFPSDPRDAIILNQSAVRALGWEGPAVGRTLGAAGGQRTVVGVVEDFNFAGMRHQIEPVLLLNQEGAGRFVSIRIDRDAPLAAVDGIRAAWEAVYPAYPFEFTFFTEEFNRLFSDDEEFSAMLVQFTFIAILIACLGLYGLASFTTEQKTKEFGIRKALGAPAGHLLHLVTRETLVLILAANLLAWGASWILMERWLSGFAYRIDLPLSGFVLATAGTTLLALLTVGREMAKVLKANPVVALRYE